MQLSGGRVEPVQLDVSLSHGSPGSIVATVAIVPAVTAGVSDLIVAEAISGNFAVDVGGEKRTAKGARNGASESVAPDGCDVMISYDERTGVDQALGLANVLTMSGLKPFCAALYCPLQLAEDWRTTSEKALLSSKLQVFVALTDHGHSSEKCTWELERAIDRVHKEGDMRIIRCHVNRSAAGEDDEEARSVIHACGRIPARREGAVICSYLRNLP